MNWFNGWISVVENQGYLEYFKSNPQNILNLDESGFLLNQRRGKVVTLKEMKHTYAVNTSKAKLNITMTMTVGADGFIFTPQIIFKSNKIILESIL